MRHERTLLVVAWSWAVLSLSCSGGAQGQDPAPIPPEYTRPAERGGLTQENIEEIKAAERAGNAAITDCYTDELERLGNKKLEGKVTVEIQIGTDGRALSVGINEATLKAPRVHACIQTVIKTWDFPRLKAPSNYGTTFSFTPAY